VLQHLIERHSSPFAFARFGFRPHHAKSVAGAIQCSLCGGAYHLTSETVEQYEMNVESTHSLNSVRYSLDKFEKLVARFRDIMDQYALTQDAAEKRKLVAVGKQVAREAREIVRKGEKQIQAAAKRLT
jgi:hypothetical protein